MLGMYTGGFGRSHLEIRPLCFHGGNDKVGTISKIYAKRGTHVTKVGQFEYFCQRWETLTKQVI
jgi:hypothetical protein